MGTQYEETNLQLGATETDYTDIGDITVPDGATKITGICMEVAGETSYATMGYLGVAKIEYQGAAQIEGIPVHIVHAVATGQVFYVPEFIPVNIRVDAKTIIAAAIKLTVAQTGTTIHGKCCLRFE